MSNMYNKFIYNYNSIVSVPDMLKNGQLNLLRYKFIRKEGLIFSKSGGINTYSTLFSLYQTIKSFEDYQFYCILFTHYQKYISEFYPSKTNIISKLEELSNKIISTDCLVALLALIEVRKYIPTQSNMNTAVLHGSLETIDYFLASHQHLQINVNKLFNDKVGTDYIKQLVLLNHLYKQINIMDGEKVLLKIFRLNSNLVEMKTPNKELMNLTSHSIINEYTDVQSLITIVKVIMHVNQIEIYNNNSTLFGNNQPHTINSSQVKQFEIDLQAKQQLNLKLNDQQHQKEPNRSIIMVLLDIYYFYSKEIKPLLQFYFGNNSLSNIDNNQEIKSICMVNNYFECSLLFCNVSIFRWLIQQGFDQLFMDYIMYTSFQLSQQSKPIPFFSHCSDINVKIQFINEVAEHFLHYQFGFKFFVEIVIGSSCLELVQHIFLLPSFTGELLDPSISKFIKSPQVLTWLFEKHNDLFNDSSWWYFKDNLDLIKCFEELCAENLQFTSNPARFNKCILSKPVVDFIIDCNSINKTDYQVYRLIFGMESKFNSFKFDMARTVYYKTIDGIIKKSTCSIDYKHFIRKKIPTQHMQLLKYVHWIYKNHNYQIQVDGHFYIDKQTQELIFKQIGKYSLLNLQSLLQEPTPFNFDYITHVLKLIFEKIQCVEESKGFLKNLLYRIGQEGDRRSFLHIFQYHNFILRKKLNGNNYLFTFDELKRILTNSLDREHLDFALLLSNFIYLRGKDGHRFSRLSKSFLPKLN